MDAEKRLNWDKYHSDYHDLKGTLGLCFIFVTRPKDFWYTQFRDEFNKKFVQEIQCLKREAEKRKVPLRVFKKKFVEEYDQVFGRTDNQKLIEAFYKQQGAASNKELLDRFAAKTAPDCKFCYVFIMPGQGRSYAQSVGGRSSSFAGNVVTYASDSSKHTLFHELCHLFGAVDLYYPKEISDKARKWMPKSIMLSASEEIVEIDELTQYLIGWSDKPSPKAREILNIASTITSEEYNKKLKEQWESEYCTVEYSNSIYQGPVKNGMRNGRGVLRFNSGDVYEGEFVDDQYEGFGKFTYQDGTYHVGTYKNGKRNGQGTTRFKSGAIEQGTYVDGELNGYGKILYSNGNKYKGEIKNGKRNGQGTMHFKSGTIEQGTYVDGELNGYGKIFYNNGDRYEGELKDGKLNGKGIIRYSNGTQYEGYFKDGNFSNG